MSASLLTAIEPTLACSPRLSSPWRSRASSAPPISSSRRSCRAHRKREQFRGRTEAEYRAWLRAILARLLADAARRIGPGQAGRAESLERALHESSQRLERWLASEESTPSQGLLRQERLLELSEALDRLPEDQRTALELRYLQGLSVGEVCRRMGRSTSSVASLLYRGLKGLRERMGDEA